MAIAGVMDGILLICDPIYGESAMQYKAFPDAYKEGAAGRPVTSRKRGLT